MTEEENDIELIEGYLRQTLDEPSRAAVEQRIKNDIDFAEKVDDYRFILEGLQREGVDAFRKEVQSWEMEISKSESSPRTLWTYLSVAAALALVIAAGIYFYQQPSWTQEEIVTHYFQPYENVLTVRGEAETDTLGIAMSLYTSGKYAAAIPYFEACLVRTRYRADALFYLGQSKLAMYEYARAITLFTTLKTLDHPYRDQVEWYLALAYLGDNKPADAKRSFNTIAGTINHTYALRAEEVLKRME